MTEKERNHSPASLFSGDLYASWRTGMKQMITSYIETSEKLANGMLSFHEKATAWAKDTPWAPFFKAQNSLAGKVIEGSSSMARKLWHMQKEEETPEKMKEAQE